jgi:aryl-alcohol dehydrogenase-like predicted oxidoreductase
MSDEPGVALESSAAQHTRAAHRPLIGASEPQVANPKNRRDLHDLDTAHDHTARADRSRDHAPRPRAWAIGGGDWEHGWGPQDDEESIAAIHHALELGINWIDTASAYGFGHSEQVVGRALQGMSGRPYVFTKCSLLEGPDRRVVHSLNRDSILREVGDSLARLGVEAIDLYQIHWPNPDADIEKGWAALADLKAEGLVRHIGVSNFDVEQLRGIEQIAPVETLQPQYSLIERGIERQILPTPVSTGSV